MQLGLLIPTLQEAKTSRGEYELFLRCISFACLAEDFVLLEVIIMDPGPLPDNLWKFVNINIGAIIIPYFGSLRE